MSYYYGSLICHCDECGADETFDNPRRYDSWVLQLKALKKGWYLPGNGRQRCPVCHQKIAQAAGMESLIRPPFPKAQTVQKALDNLASAEAVQGQLLNQ